MGSSTWAARSGKWAWKIANTSRHSRSRTERSSAGTLGHRIASTLWLPIRGSSMRAAISRTWGSTPRPGIAAIDAVTGATTTWGPQMTEVPPSVYALTVSSGVVYAGGNFTLMGGQARRGLAAVDVSTGQVTDWNPRPSGLVNALATTGTNVFVGGAFTSVGSEARSNLAAFDLSSGRVTPWNPGANGSVKAMAPLGNTLYVGGTFQLVGGQLRDRVGALDATTGLATAWNAGSIRSYEASQVLPTFSIHQVRVNALIATPDAIYMGGHFTSVGGQNRYDLVALDPASGACLPWVFDVGGDVYALASSAGVLFLGGCFGSAGGGSRPFRARADEMTAAVLPWNPQANGLVRSLAFGHGQVYVGGYFSSVGGQPRNNLAAVDTGTGQVLPFHPDPDNSVLSLSADENFVYAGGAFSTIGGQARSNLAALDWMGTVEPWDPEANAAVENVNLTSAGLVSSGEFTVVDGQPQTYVAVMQAAPVAVEEPSSVPKGFELSLSPNPFHRGTKVRFFLSSPGPVQLGWYDAAGRRVGAAIERRSMSAGWQTIEMNTPLRSGVYWVRLDVAGKRSTIKALRLD